MHYPHARVTPPRMGLRALTTGKARSGKPKRHFVRTQFCGGMFLFVHNS